MKETLVLLLVSVVSTVAIRCWNCENAKSLNECMQKGFLETCTSILDVCSTQVRQKEKSVFIFKRCKQNRACFNNMKQNSQKDGETIQCNESTNSSLCTCCCGRNRCNIGRRTCSPTVLRAFHLTRRKTSKHSTTEATITMTSTTPTDINKENSIPSSQSGLSSSDHSRICPLIGPLPHGRVTCSNRNYIGSVCHFECTEAKYEIHPSQNNDLRCMSSATWDKEEPCCSLPCPPYALFDIISMIHASDNKTYRMLTMVTRFLMSSLKISEDSGALHAYMEFSGDVDYTLTFKDTLEGKNVPIPAKKRHNTPDGKTNIGKALSWAHQNFRGTESGNRKIIRDVIFLATDSSSNDDVKKEVQKWKDDDVLIFVLFMPNRNAKYPDYDQMLEIVGQPDHIYQFDTDAHRTGKQVLLDLLNHFCYNRCDHLLHEHYVKSNREIT